MVVGGGSGIGREVALQIAKRGGHVVVADANLAGAAEAAADAATLSSDEMVHGASMDLTSRDIDDGARCARRCCSSAASTASINTAAIFPTPDPSDAARAGLGHGRSASTSRRISCSRRRPPGCSKAQKLPASIVLTSSANAVVPKAEARRMTSARAAINHLMRELAIGLGPLVRVNGIAPGHGDRRIVDVPARSRHRVAAGNTSIAFDESESTEDLRTKLAEFYAQRTITKRPILPIDNANAICWLAGEQSAKTTGHVIPVDGGLPEAFLRYLTCYAGSGLRVISVLRRGSIQGVRIPDRGRTFQIVAVRDLHQLIVRVDVIRLSGVTS
mgnify:CR=1 FL=1